MAQTYQCDVCGEVAADFMVTVIQDGSVVAVGVECLLDWALPIAEAYQAAMDRERPIETQNVAATDPPDQEADQGPTDTPQDPQEPAGDTDEEWEASARPGTPRGRKRAAEAPENDGRTDAQAEASADVAR